MKKLTFYIATAALVIAMIPNHAKAGTEDDQVISTSIETVDANAAIDAESEALLDRLEEINEMDKSDLTRSEKKELRKEVREIDKTLTLNAGGVYLSVGALILVVVLLILLL